MQEAPILLPSSKQKGFLASTAARSYGSPHYCKRLAIENSLRRLQTDHVDLYQIHANDSLTPAEETLRALDDLVRSGKIRYIGLSNRGAWRVATALGISTRMNPARFSTLQAYSSIAGRDLERELVALLEAEKMGLLVWSPLAGGLLLGRFSRENQTPDGSRRTNFDFPVVNKERAWNVIDVMASIAQAHDCSPARIALAWLLSKPVVTSVLVGGKRLSHLEENIAAADITLMDDEIERLDAVSQLPLSQSISWAENRPAGHHDLANRDRVAALVAHADHSNPGRTLASAAGGELGCPRRSVERRADRSARCSE